MKKRKEYVGQVVSDKMEKTVVVAIDRTVKHPRYKEYIKGRCKFMAHDEAQRCRIGDKVKLIETRPLSAKKRFAVLEILKHAKEV